jgi:hypothetical protein
MVALRIEDQKIYGIMGSLESAPLDATLDRILESLDGQ